MINLKITEGSQKILYNEIQNKIDGSKELISQKTKIELINSIYSISYKNFIKTTNLKARSIPASFHHVYEWGKVGQESGRLFKLIKTNESSSINIYYKFINSKKVVPISKDLSKPGITDKKVSKSKIFKRKAEVMESGKPVSFITKKTIVFSDKGDLIFVPPGKNINILNPGGKATSNSFSKHFVSWWTTQPSSIAENSGIFKSLENNVSKTLNINNAGKISVSSTISETLKKYEILGDVI